MLLTNVFRAGALLALASAICGTAVAEASYPAKPVRIVVPAATGGSNTIIARLLSERLQLSLGQPFYVDNRGGAGGVIGVNAVAKAPPDGYTLLLTFGGPIATGLALLKNVPYEPARELTAIARVADVPLVMVASPHFPAKSVEEVIAYGKANPGKLRASINTPGAMGHLLTEQFRLENGFPIVSVPYKGTGQALPDIVSGQIDIAVDTVPALQELIKAGRLNALAVTSPARVDVLPNVPTFTELGIPNMEVTTWFALFAPAGTPRSIIDKLAASIESALKTPEVREQFARQGAIATYQSPADLTSFVQQETVKWTRVIKLSGMRPD